MNISGRIALASAILLLAGCGGGGAGTGTGSPRIFVPRPTPRPAEPVPDDLQLFLLIGQSNMSGRGYIQEQDATTDSGLWMIGKTNAWTPARDPIHFDTVNVGVGPGHQFARTLKEREPTAHIGLIPAAVGGTSLDEWHAGGALYKRAVARARVAMTNGQLKGILWHQGEADSYPGKIESYPQRFAAIIAQLRIDLDAPDVPVIIGELDYSRAKSAAFNATIPTIAAAVPNCGWVSARGLPDRGDQLHFSAAGARRLGERYAEKFLELESAR